MATYLDRYKAGDHEAVWRELRLQGAEVRREPLRSQALDVCRELVDRAYENAVALRGRLLDLGYMFAHPDAVLVPTTTNDARALSDIEAEVGLLPLVAEAWYSVIASLDFQQAECQLQPDGTDSQPEPSAVLGLGSHPVLLVQSVSGVRSQRSVLIAEDARYAEDARQRGRESRVEAYFSVRATSGK
jgi:hypothetical protein